MLPFCLAGFDACMLHLCRLINFIKNLIALMDAKVNVHVTNTAPTIKMM